MSEYLCQWEYHCVVLIALQEVFAEEGLYQRNTEESRGIHGQNMYLH